MNNFFCNTYTYLSTRKGLFYFLLIVPIILMGIAISQIKFTEDITSFFPVEKEKTSVIFKNLRIKDKIVFIIDTPLYDDKEFDTDSAINIAESFIADLNKRVSVDNYAKLTTQIDHRVIEKTSKFINSNLPILLSNLDFDKLDSLTTTSSITEAMRMNYNYIISSAGGFMGEFIYNDPLKIGSHLFAGLEQMNIGSNYKVIDSYIFNSDSSQLLMFAQLDPDCKQDRKSVV